MSDNPQEVLFPSIGEVAEQTDQVPDEAPTEARDDEDTDRPVKEVESLCMNCGENVSSTIFFRLSLNPCTHDLRE